MNRIEAKFKELKRRNKKAFIAFITAGYPDLNTTAKLVAEFSRQGVDIVELGVPFSDPMADGPIIQESSQQALKRNINLNDIFGLVRALRKKSVDVPILLMTYYNPIFCFGEDKFVNKAVGSGVDGVIIPDLPPEEAGTFIKAAGKVKLDTIFFIAPTSTLQRIKFICRVSKGFIYYVSLTGVTGPRQKLPLDLIKNLKVIKKYTSKPVCVGFGVSRKKQVKEISKIADGVIIGSAIVDKIRLNLGKSGMLEKVSHFIRGLKT